jgi:hypothetical protein
VLQKLYDQVSVQFALLPERHLSCQLGFVGCIPAE